MDYGLNRNPTYPHVYQARFSSHEAEALSAAFREHVNYILAAQSEEDVSDFMASVASWGAGSGEHSLYWNDPSLVMQRLLDFADHTINEATALSRDVNSVAFEDRKPAKRLVLGRNAGKLATDIQQLHEALQVQEGATDTQETPSSSEQ